MALAGAPADLHRTAAPQAGSAQTATPPARPLTELTQTQEPAPRAQAEPLPRVRLVATGGTISDRDGARLTAEDLVKSLPGLDRYVRPEFEQFANVASSSLTLTQWVSLARRINTLFKEDRDLTGIVVTSGTDTLEETA